MKRETVALSVKSLHAGGPNGVFYLEAGQVVHAQYGDCSGVDALRDALRLREGPFRVDLNVKTPQRTIFETLSKLHLEETWRLDEEGGKLADEQIELEIRLIDEEVESEIQLIDEQVESEISLIEEDSMHTSSSQPPPKLNSAPTLSGRPAARPRISRQMWRNLAVGTAALVLVGVVVFLRWHASRESPAAVGIANAMPLPVLAPQAAVLSPASALLPLVQGVTAKEIFFAQAVPLSGSAKELGRQMKMGVEIAFEGA